MSNARRVQRNTITKAQMDGGRVQRNTITQAQMEGMGIWSSIKKFVKKYHIASRVLGAAGLIAKFVPLPGASVVGTALGAAGTVAGLAGYGHKSQGMSGKGLTKTQMKAIRQGLGSFLPSGGISLSSAKYLYPSIKNVLPSQVRSIASGFGRLLKSGGISLRGGAMSGNYKKDCLYQMHCPARKNRVMGAGYSGRGVKLAGQGTSLAGTGRVYTQRRKSRKRKSPRAVFRF